MSKPIEAASDLQPFVYRLTPVWGDLDPARIVYTGRYTDYALRAIDGWMLDRAGADFYRMNFEWGIGTPFVHTELDLKSSLTPRDTLLVTVRIAKVGTTSLAFRVDGAASRGSSVRPCFEGRFVCVCVEAAAQSENLRAIPLDPRIRAAAEADMAML